jgi:hypothetical protein
MASGSDGPGLAARLHVADPYGYWRRGSAEDAGCHLSAGQPLWAIGPEHAQTAEGAVAALVATFSSEDVATYDAHDAEVGYVDAETQTWVAQRTSGSDGPAGFTIQVTRDGSDYVASPDSICD